MTLFPRMLSLSITLFFCSSVMAEDLTPAEAKTLIKEDIAAAQVMLEVCPKLIGQNEKFKLNTDQLIKHYLQNYSDPSMTFEKIQTDPEYRIILNEALQAVKETDQAEQTAGCTDVLHHQL